MHLFFIDDSGSLPKGLKFVNHHFILGGLVIPEEQWHSLKIDFSQICKQFRIQGEIKWRYFGQKIGQETKESTLTHLSFKERDELRTQLFSAVAMNDSIKIIATVVHLPTLYSTPYLPLSADVVYSHAYKPLTERFQYHLQDLSRKHGARFNGIIICDQRNPNQDRILSGFHNNLLNSENSFKSKYNNLIEHLFLSPSHYSIGLQFADLIAGAIARYFERGDKRWYQLIESNFRKDPYEGNKIEGFGLIRFPKEPWKENDAESEKESLNLQL